MGIRQNIAGFQPGDIKKTARATLEAGWQWCDGGLSSRTTEAALFAEIGTTHGAGDGATTFNRPDMRGRAAFGKDDMGGTAANRLTTAGGGLNGVTLGAVGGGETKTITTPQSPSHTHSLPVSGVGTVATAAQGAGQTGTLVSAATGGGGAHSVIPPALVVNYIIKI